MLCYLVWENCRRDKGGTSDVNASFVKLCDKFNVLVSGFGALCDLQRDEANRQMFSAVLPLLPPIVQQRIEESPEMRDRVISLSHLESAKEEAAERCVPCGFHAGARASGIIGTCTDPATSQGRPVTRACDKGHDRTAAKRHGCLSGRRCDAKATAL